MAMSPRTTSHRTVSPRIAELPSLRYGSIGASCATSGPLKVCPAPSLSQKYTSDSCITNRYRRSLTNPDVVGLTKTPKGPTRHVRFDIPSSTITSSETTKGDALNHVPTVRAHTSISSSLNKSSAENKMSTSHHRYGGQRHHTTGQYVRGTLSPTGNPSTPVTASTGAAVPGSAIAHTPRPPTGKQTAYRTLVSRFSVTPTHKRYQAGDLLKAARENDETALKDIIRRGIMLGLPETELNAVDSTGRTPVSYVISNGTVEILESLLQIPGININKPDNEGNTPLHFAAQAGQVECMNFLLSRCQQIEIDARNNLGFTPLMKAALQGRNKCAKLLLFAGASPTARDSGRGLRPDQWARFCGRYMCAEVIEKFARNRNNTNTSPIDRGIERSSTGLIHGTGHRWGSDTDLNTKLNASRSHSGGIRSKIRSIFRNSSSSNTGYSSKINNNNNNNNNIGGTIANAIYTDESSSTPRLASQLTAVAICASTPLLPTNATSSSNVKSLVRPLSVPKLHVTLANSNNAPASIDNFIPNNIPTGPYYDEVKKGAFYKRKK